MTTELNGIPAGYLNVIYKCLLTINNNDYGMLSECCMTKKHLCIKQ